MTTDCVIRFARTDFEELSRALFPGDNDEHGAVLLAGVSGANDRLTLHVREVHQAHDGIDYVEGKIGYRALSPRFIHRLITRARDERLAYIAVHNHDSDERVGFSRIDIQSHERGYPALLQIARGMPVGAVVLGKRSMQADIWDSQGSRHALSEAVIVGQTIRRLSPSPTRPESPQSGAFDRQIRMFGTAGQGRLRECHVAILGLGGVGSLVGEFLARLGVGHFRLVDPDVVEESNISRILGATRSDIGAQKVVLAKRSILLANPDAVVDTLPADVAVESVAKQLISSDYLFLAADSMRARLVFNALVHQYQIPGVQMGSKVRSTAEGSLLDIFAANRPVRPGAGCLWCNQLIDPSTLAKESKTDDERKDQAYGVEEPNPSVIALNAIAASHAVNDFMLDYLCLRPDSGNLFYEYFNFIKGTRSLVHPRKDEHCSECSSSGLRYGRGDLASLPCLEG